MKITDGERLLAVMLADLIKALGVSSQIDPDFVVKALTNGQAWALKSKHDALFDSDEDDEGEVQETARILTMCRAVEDSIAALASMELELISENDRLVFVGFDGNSEPHYGIAKTMIEDLGHWQEFKDRPLNSHSPMLDKYRRQYEAYCNVGRSPRDKLTVFEISQIIIA